MGILRLSHVDISEPDLELAAAYYTQVLGLDIVERTDERLFLKCWDERDHHCLSIRYDPRVGIDRFSFKAEFEDDLDTFEQAVERYGFAVRRVSKGEEVGQGESIRFETPSGHEMEIVHDIDKVGGRLPLINPWPVPQGLVGIAPPRIDHVLIHAEEVNEMTHFMQTCFDFHLTEQVLTGEGHMMGSFLQRSGRPHDIAIIQGPNGALHHFSFWLDDWDHVRRAADILAYNAISIDIGPTRHGITRGNTIYFFDPLGTRNEVFTGGYRADPDFPTITWTEDNLGRAIFYYEGKDNGRFLYGVDLMPGILRLSHVEVRVPDLELATAYYVEVIGLIEVDRSDDDHGQRVYLKGWDEHQHHSLILSRRPTYGIEALTFKVEHADDLDRLQERVDAVGVATSRHAPGTLAAGSGEIVRFFSPSGHLVELEHGQTQVGNRMPKLNPPIGPEGLIGMAPPRIDHVFLMCEDINGVSDFFRDVLEFRMTEQILADDGYQLAAFLERSHSTHDIAFLTGPDGGFHHVAFWVDDWNELRKSADICAYHGINVDAGPTRHGATHGCGLYFFDPAGNRNEIYTGGYWFDPDDEPTTWTENEIGRAIFYYQGRLNQAFMTVHS